VNQFRNGLDRTVGQFYEWAYGDVFTNIIRAAIAEYLVACAIDREHIRRSSWDGYDFEVDGIKIEVKSSACFVSGKMPTKSKTYDIKARYASWHPNGTPISEDGIARRCADVYGQTDRELADTLHASQWRFYIVPASWINERFADQKSVSRDIIARHFTPIPFARLREAVLQSPKTS
jgi:hypothetical protein